MFYCDTCLRRSRAGVTSLNDHTKVQTKSAVPAKKGRMKKGSKHAAIDLTKEPQSPRRLFEQGARAYDAARVGCRRTQRFDRTAARKSIWQVIEERGRRQRGGYGGLS